MLTEHYQAFVPKALTNYKQRQVFWLARFRGLPIRTDSDRGFKSINLSLQQRELHRIYTCFPI